MTNSLLKFMAFLGMALVAAPAYAAELDTGNTAWVIVSAALVMLMTPGLAFFYAGMVNRKNVVSTLLQNYAALAIVGLIWVVCGYSLAFSEGNTFIGGWDYYLLDGMNGEILDGGIPHYIYMAFQMMFACIAVALISGAIAERVHFKAWMLLMALWCLAVYVPVAHWVWGPGGWIAADGGLDFAGGLVVHITAGVAGLVAALMFGKRINANELQRPNDISMIMLGAALLWFGWFGFNGGSALAADALAAHAVVTTFVGASAAFVAWMLVDWAKHSHPSAAGAAIGIVVGLVTITPAAGYVSVEHAIVMCGFAGIFCNYFAHWIKTQTHLDDTLDVFACHGVGGIIGAIFTGVFASSAINSSVEVQGIWISGESELFIANIVGVIAVCVYTAAVTFALIKLVGAITPIRVTEDDESKGLDQTVHGEMSRFHERRETMDSNKAA